MDIPDWCKIFIAGEIRNLRTVSKVARVDEQKCIACAICAKICPVEAIRMEKRGKKHLAVVDEQECLDCKLCFTRCPEYAMTMAERRTPIHIGAAISDVSEKAIAEICEAAHTYPDQVICYCHRVQAKEIAAAILQGARTPEDVSRSTGARTGCGTLCITGIIRLLQAADIELTKAPGYQWYGSKVTIWDIAPEIRKKYPEYYLTEDLLAINEVFPGGKKK